MATIETVTPIDDQNHKQVMKQKLPVVLYMFDGSEKPSKPLDDAINRAAKKYDGEAIFGCLDIDEYPDLHAKYDGLQPPAVVTLTKGFLGRKMKSYGESIRPADLRAHVEYVLGYGPEPEFDAEEVVNTPKKIKGGAQHISDSNFRKTVLKSDLPVLVDFWAPWCGPCLVLAPYMDEMAKKYKGRVKVVKLDTDQNPRSKMSYKVSSIPTLIMFYKGEPVERRTGGTADVINDMLQEAILLHEGG